MALSGNRQPSVPEHTICAAAEAGIYVNGVWYTAAEVECHGWPQEPEIPAEEIAAARRFGLLVLGFLFLIAGALGWGIWLAMRRNWGL